MTAWLDPVRVVLNQRSCQLNCYFRDDDAGWDDLTLFKLLDLFQLYAVPIDLAVIPKCLSKVLATELVLRISEYGHQIGLHQHGYNHSNHQSTGRKCEFGDCRTADQQFSDIVIGQRILKDCLGDYLQPMFTPPWNRCTQDTVDVLESLGFESLSRDYSAVLLQTDQLQEIPVHIDWFAKRKGVRLDFQMLGKQMAQRIQQHDSIGIMLHHQMTSADERAVLAELLELVSTHSSVHTCLMTEISGCYSEIL